MRIQIANPTKCTNCRTFIGFLNFYDEKKCIGKCPVCNKVLKMETAFEKTIFTLANR